MIVDERVSLAKACKIFSIEENTLRQVLETQGLPSTDDVPVIWLVEHYFLWR